MTDKIKLLTELKQFTGADSQYYLPLFPMFRYTEGVRYLALNANAFWFITDVFAHQFIAPFKDEAFQVWKIKVSENHKAIIIVEDGNKKVLKTINLEYTDFPIEEFALWFVDNVLILPNEY